MLSAKQIMFRITAVTVVNQLVVIVLLSILPKQILVMTAIINVILLIILTAPTVYWFAINPYLRQHQELINHIDHLASHDDLTSLGNRQMLHDSLTHLLSYNVRYGIYGAILFVELDKFKLINARFGLDAGDTVLIVTAQRLTSILRKEDVVCRAGGNEFYILLSKLDNDNIVAHQKAMITAERIATALEVPIIFKNHPLQIKANIGLRLITPVTASVSRVLNDVEIAMYSAKRSVVKKIGIFDDPTPRVH